MVGQLGEGCGKPMGASSTGSVAVESLPAARMMVNKNLDLIEIRYTL